MPDLDPAVEAVLALVNTDTDEQLHLLHAGIATTLTWDYEHSRPPLVKLAEQALRSQWSADDLPWDVDVDQEAVVQSNRQQNAQIYEGFDSTGAPWQHWGEKEWLQFGVESQNWMLSQFLHGEQGALVCTARVVETVPWFDAKQYAATQVLDEARHVEVFARYLDTKLSGHYPVNTHLGALLDDIITDGRWDITYLGMQIMVEGLALGAFGFLHALTTEPLLKEMLRLVMADEARHVAFGILSLEEFYAGLSGAEIRERQEFAYDAALRMRDRFLHQEVWERMGVDVRHTVEWSLRSPERTLFQSLLFAKIVPSCRRLGLLDAGDGWLRDRFDEMGVIGFADDGE